MSEVLIGILFGIVIGRLFEMWIALREVKE